jgi:hypothetical protein
MAMFIGIVAVLLGSTGLLSFVSLRGRLSQNGALFVLFYVFQAVMLGSFDLLEAFRHTPGGPLRFSASPAGWRLGGWLFVSISVAFLLRAACLRLAAALIGYGVRPPIPAERPIAQLVRSLREQPREEVVRQVQERYVAPARLVEELIQRAQ